jgi:hypothetical protein
MTFQAEKPALQHENLIHNIMQSHFALTARMWLPKHNLVLHGNHARALIACLFAARAEGRVCLWFECSVQGED